MDKQQILEKLIHWEAKSLRDTSWHGFTTPQPSILYLKFKYLFTMKGNTPNKTTGVQTSTATEYKSTKFGQITYFIK